MLALLDRLGLFVKTNNLETKTSRNDFLPDKTEHAVWRVLGPPKQRPFWVLKLHPI